MLPVVTKTPVLAGVNGTDPFIIPKLFLEELRALGFAGIQNFPTVGLFDGDMRQAFEETGMSYQLEVDIIRLANQMDMLTTPYVFNPSEAERMADAGADIDRRAHGGHDRRIDWREELEIARRLREADPGHRRRGSRRQAGRARHLPRRADLGAARRGVHHQQLPRRGRLLRRELGGAAAGGARDRRADQARSRAFDGRPADDTCVAKGPSFRHVEHGAHREGAVGQALVAVGAGAHRHEAADARARDDAAGDGPPVPLPSIA